MSILEAIIFGLIQGLTEFIPISSTAHLTLAGKLMGQIKEPEQWTAFIAVIQLGTLIAVIIYFWADIIKIIAGFVSSNLALITKRPVSDEQKREARLGWLIIIGTIPISIVGLLFKDQIEGSLTKDLRVIAASLIGLALILTVAEIVGRQRREMRHLNFKDAFIVGFAQVFALIPGSSRSGTTITGGLLAGLTRETAARFSFLLSIPAIGASGLLELPQAFALDSSRLDGARGRYGCLGHFRLSLNCIPAQIPSAPLDLSFRRLPHRSRIASGRAARDRQDCAVIMKDVNWA